MDGSGPPPAAPRTCARCKSGKKKCDKLLPKCSRCRRLAIECQYPGLEIQNESDAGQDGTDTGQDGTDARFEDVFRRLTKLEAQVFQSGGATQEWTVERLATHMLPDSPQGQGSATMEALLAQRAEVQGFTSKNFQSWIVNPGALTPGYMTMVLWASTMRVLSEHKITEKDVANAYFDTTDKWLPMISRTKVEKGQALFQKLDSNDAYLLLLLAMHIVITPFPDHPPAPSLEESPWYRICKYHFAQYVALATPSIELIQTGMLIALFEHLQCIGDRALTTVGICARLAFDLELDEVVARQANHEPGGMSPNDEEAVLTWWGLSRLESYFNMSPRPISKKLSMPSQVCRENSNGPVNQGPPTVGFVTVDSESLDACIFELEASRYLGRVQTFIRENRFFPAPLMSDNFRLLQKQVQEYLIMLKIRMQNSGGLAGVGVMLGAALHLECFIAEKQGSLDTGTMRSIHSYVLQILEAVGQCRIWHGFTANYLDGIQPTWVSIPYQAIGAYKGIRAADVDRILPEIDTTICLEVLQTMAPHYKLAEKCLRLLEQS